MFRFITNLWTDNEAKSVKTIYNQTNYKNKKRQKAD